MNEIHKALLSVLRADSPLAYAGSVAMVVCAVWVLGLVVWGCRWLTRVVRSRRADSRTGGRPLPQLATPSDVRVVRHIVHSDKTSPYLDRVGQIEPNQPVRVMTDHRHGFDTFVLDTYGSEIRLALPMAALANHPIPASRRVRLIFARSDDARYRVTSRILDVGRNNSNLRVRAVEELKRVQERSEFRVRCNADMRFGRIAAAPVARRRKSMALPEEARLNDISVGGASFICSADLEAGARIVVQLTTSDGELRLAGRVLRRKELGATSVKKFRTCVEFPALSAAEERRLGRFVAACQQEWMKRMSERRTSGTGQAVPAPAQVSANTGLAADRVRLAAGAPVAGAPASPKERSTVSVGR